MVTYDIAASTYASEDVYLEETLDGGYTSIGEALRKALLLESTHYDTHRNFKLYRIEEINDDNYQKYYEEELNVKNTSDNS